MTAQFCAPASCPAKSAFLRFRAMGRIVRSTGLLSSSMRPSSRNRHNPSQYFAMYFRASPVGDLVETQARFWASHSSNASIMGFDRSFRAARRWSALRSRRSFSMRYPRRSWRLTPLSTSPTVFEVLRYALSGRQLQSNLPKGAWQLSSPAHSGVKPNCQNKGMPVCAAPYGSLVRLPLCSGPTASGISSSAKSLRTATTHICAERRIPQSPHPFGTLLRNTLSGSEWPAHFAIIKHGELYRPFFEG